MRDLIRSTAQDLGVAGFDFDTGWGAINGCAIADRISPRWPIIDICRRYPWLCYPRPIPVPFPRFPLSRHAPSGRRPQTNRDWTICPR